jgi:hypothetical protein
VNTVNTAGKVQSVSPTELLDTYRLDQDRGGSTIGVNAILHPQTLEASRPALVKVGQPLGLNYAI